jgi:hypothetical protein
MRIRSWILIIITIVTITGLASCRQDDPTPEPPTKAPATEVQVESVGSPETDPTDLPTAVVTIVQVPAATSTLPATATLDPTPTATPVSLLSATDFGDNRNPLTGELVEDPETLQRRPLAVKISNAPAQWVRPQSGLNDADLVFEHITEAGITRFTMILYGKSPEDVGPIRSARLIDLEIPAMYDAALVYSGSSEGVRQKLLNSDFVSRIFFGGDGYYRTGAAKPLEHTLYGKPELFWRDLATRGLNQAPVLNTHMAFTSVPPADGQEISEAIIDYDWTIIDWRYDPETGRFLRWTDGLPHLDANTEEQVSAANVVVILANHYDDPTICEQIINGVCTSYSVQPVLTGTGPATIFRDGQRFDGNWNRVGRYDMLTFTGENGEVIPLQIGNTWFQVIPIWYDNPITVKP